MPRKLPLAAALLALVLLPASARANSLSIHGSMEGAVQIANGDKVAGGYVFAFQGSHPQAQVLMANAQIVFQGRCSNGGLGTLTLPLRPGPASGGSWTVTADDDQLAPAGNEGDPSTFEGSTVASVCGGSGSLDASSGATFNADLQSSDTHDPVKVQFHYRDPNAKGKGNNDCSASTYAADVCGASWSGTATLTPDAIPPSPPPCANGSGSLSSGSSSCSSTCTPSSTGSGSSGTPPCSTTCTPSSSTSGSSGAQSCSTTCTPSSTSSGSSPGSTTCAGTTPVAGVKSNRTTVRPRKGAARHRTRARRRARARHPARRVVTPHFTG